MLQSKYIHFFSSLLLTISLLLVTSIVSAAEAPKSKADKVPKEPMMYYPITPNTLTFYQGTGKKIAYIVVQVQLAVRGQKNLDLLDANLPLIQDTLTDFFNRQDKKTIEDLSLREELRENAKVRLSEVLIEETSKDIIENVLFTQYIYQ